MRDSTFRALARALLAVSLLATLACGGGGGDGGNDGEVEPPPPLSIYDGSHGFTSFQGSTDPVLTHADRWGRLASDGAGALLGDYGYNDSSSVDSASQDYTYETGADRQLRLANGGEEFVRGRVVASGRLAALGYSLSGYNPGLWLTLRRGSGQSDADLVGVYHGCALGFIVSLNKPEGRAGTYTFNGDGTWSSSYRANVDGMIHGPTNYAAGLYSVGSVGSTALSFDTSFTERGQLLEDGDVLTVAGGIDEGNTLLFHTFVRAGSGMTDATLSGTYALIGMTYDFSTGVLDWAGLSGNLTANGAGAWTATLRRNVSGVISSSFTETGAYTLSPAGQLFVTRADGSNYEGGLSPDGTFAVFGGGISNGSRPAMFYLVK